VADPSPRAPGSAGARRVQHARRPGVALEPGGAPETRGRLVRGARARAQRRGAGPTTRPLARAGGWARRLRCHGRACGRAGARRRLPTCAGRRDELMGRVGLALFTHEFLERTRDRWVVVVSVVFGLLASAVSLYAREAEASASRLTG